MEKLQRYIGYAWQPTLMYIAASLIVFGLLFFRLGTLVKPFAPSELAARHSSSSIAVIAENPVNAPHKIGQYVAQKAGRKGPLAMRTISALYGLLAVWLFFLIAGNWFTPRMAALGTLMFATSGWFLHIARSATPHITLMGVLALIACGAWLRYSNRRSLAIVVAAITTAVSLYIPGLVWFVLIFLVLQRRSISEELRRISSHAIILAFLLWLLLLTPIAIASIRDPQILRTLIGAPAALASWSDIGKNLLSIPLHLFLLGPQDPAMWLGRLPLLDVFSAAMLILGTYRLYAQRKLDRTKLLIGSLVIGSLLIALGGPVNITILLPFLYILITSGFSLLMQQWFTVFPRNPFARSIGFILLSTSVLLAVFYHVNRYFVAWPNAPATKQVYNQQP